MATIIDSETGSCWTCSGATDIGRQRTRNEDTFAISENRGLLVVADGMGGHRAGDVASRLAVEQVLLCYSVLNAGGPSDGQRPVDEYLTHALQTASDAVLRASSREGDWQGMGCTLIAAVLQGEHLHTAHMGDVRAYLAGPEQLLRVTRDHSYLEESRSDLGLSPHELGGDPRRNLVTRAIGLPTSAGPECSATRVGDYTRVLLCSDGLWSMVDDRQLHRVLTTAPSPARACDRLIEWANVAGGADNITAVVAFRS